MKIIWGKDRLFIIDETQPERVQQAVELVESAIQGKIGFCWRSVPKIPMHGSFEINNKIERRQRALMVETSDRIVPHIQEEIKKLKQKAKEFILFDEVSEKKLKRNYHRLNKALILLSSQGLIGSYTLLATGRLKVAWFEQWQKPVLITIKQRFICTYNDSLAIKTNAQIGDEYFNDTASWPGIVWPNEEDGIIGNVASQGVVHKLYEGNVESGPVGIDPVVLRYRQGQDVQIPELKEVSELLEGLEPKDIVKVLAYLMYMKEKYKEIK
jgi:hypothetical protein